MKLKYYLFLILFIPHLCMAALLEEKLSSTSREVETTSPTPVKKTFTSPYQSLSQGNTSLLKPISKISEQKEPEIPVFEVIIPYKIGLKFDRHIYHQIKREQEKIVRIERKELEERKAKMMIEKQKLEEEEEEKIKELKVKIVREEKEKFEEKTALLEDEIEQELARRKAKREEEEKQKILAAKKIEEEIKEKERIEREKKLSAQQEKERILEVERKAQLEARQKAEEEKITKQKEKEEKERLAKKQEEEKRKQEEKKKEEEEFAKYKELDIDKMLDRELPADSKLTIDGTKVINIKAGNGAYLSSQRRKKNEKPPGLSGINIQQQLTVKLQGIIKEKINVSVDYSDVDNSKKQNFYINYKGDPKEVVQKVEFGDVKFTAPNTEFVSYNQQVFGVSAEAKVTDKVKLWGIASRSKGLRQTKEFKGDKKIISINRPDTSYIAQKYYDLLPAIWREGKNITPPITLVNVYIDDRNGDNNNNNATVITATATITIGTETYSHQGNFDIQYEGKDYVFDKTTNILTLKQNVGDNYIVGVVLRDETGKYFPQNYPNDLMMIEPGKITDNIKCDVFEQRNYYSIGKNIPTDTDLKIEIIDTANKNFYDKNNNSQKDSDEYYYLQIFGLDNNGDGKIDDDSNNDFIDHNAGIISFPDETPFELNKGTENPFLANHSDLWTALGTLSISYDTSAPYDQQHKYTIVGSYTTKIKTYMLEFNMVEGSEQVYVDNKLLTRDKDYFIDYDTGFLSFMPQINITEYTTIKIDYEYTPFIGTRYQKSIAGLRGEWTPNSNFSLGSTYLFEGAQKLIKIPKISDPMLSNLQVIDVNTSLKVTPLLKDLFNLEKNLPIEMTISGEVAKSYQNENTFGSAIIDAMEGVEESRKITMDENNWQLGSLPESTNRAKLFYGKDNYGKLLTTSPPHRSITDISGPYAYEENVKWEEDKTDENVLRLDYTDFGTNSWISIVQPLSNTPLDFTDYTHLEIWLRDTDLDKMDELFIDLGEVSENVDRSEITNRSPRTEDTNKDYLLNPGEDVGWSFTYPDGITTKIGAENNQLDTEDLDGDGVLRTKEEYFVLKVKEFKEKVNIRNKIDNWQLWSIPLSKAQIGTGTPRWSAIKQIRLRFKGTETLTNGEICVGGIEMIGTGRWVVGTVTPSGAGTFNLSSKNAEDDNYPSIKNNNEYKKLYPDEEMTREETLVLTYQLNMATVTNMGTQTTRGYTYRTFPTQQNYNNYKYLKFWLYGDGRGEKFIIRFGVDENNYFAYTLPIDFSGWKLITIDLDDFKNKLIGEIEEGKRKGTATPPYNYAQLPYGYEAKNNPNFDNIKWISLGIENTSATQSITGEIYVNDIYLNESYKSNGMARKLAINTKYKDYLSIDWGQRVVDADFNCIGRTPQTNDTQRQDVKVSFTRIKYLPVTYEWFKEISKLDPTKGTNLLNNESGQTTAKYQKLSTNFKVKEFAQKIKNFPDITINIWADAKAVNTARRNKKEDETHENLHGDTSYVYNYTFPKKIFKYIPTGESLSLSSTYKHNEDWSKNNYEVEVTKNDRILTRGQDEALTLKFTPIKTLTGISKINFNQTLKKTYNISQDDKKYYLTSRILEQTFERVVYSGIPFISPRIDTGMKYVEAYKGTFTRRTKDINTTAHFGLTTEKALNPFEWYPKVKNWPRYKFVTFTPEWTLDVTANYYKISGESGSWKCIKNIYNDYYKGQLLKGEGPKTGQYPTFGGERNSASNKRILKLKSNWYTNWKPLEQTSLDYTRTDEKTQNQSSFSNALTNAYDLNLSINLLTALHKYNKFLGTGPSDKTNFTNKYSWSKTESNEITTKTELRPSLTWNRVWKQGLDTNFSLTHVNSQTKKQSGKKDFTLTMTPSFQINRNIEKPKPVKLPFGRKITLQRKLTTKTIFRIDLQKEGKDNITTKDTGAFSFDLSGTYDLQKNVKSSLSGKIGYTWNKLEKDKDYYNYEVGFDVKFTF